MWRQGAFDPIFDPLLVLVALLCLMVKVARADPCITTEDGTQVICERAGFDRAVQKCSDAIGGEAACKVKLDAALKSWEELSIKYQACVNDKSPSVKPMIGYMAGLIGLSAVAISPVLSNTSPQVQWSVGIGGALLVASGFWLVLP